MTEARHHQADANPDCKWQAPLRYDLVKQSQTKEEEVKAKESVDVSDAGQHVFDDGVRGRVHALEVADDLFQIGEVQPQQTGPLDEGSPHILLRCRTRSGEGGQQEAKGGCV